ncbi:MAG: DegT/DnrJ/EryC1/StrS family aminotransferase [Verrucomicrobia bacterium]|nr:DegT/DnrJ/EryC1/StrS family aminotransferase [Verrucomicrobiota bacterium]
MRKKISFAGPWITQREIDYAVDAVKNGWYETYDLHTKRLEKAVCDYLGVKHAIATHCCTVALHLGCEVLDFKEGDEIICTDFSWVATAHAIAYTGATPVFVDVEPDSWCISADAIRKAITKKTKGIMLVHSFGQLADMDQIMAIAREHDLRVIEDAAPSLGAIYHGQKTGTFGDIGCFSFQGAKIAVSGEGGVLVTNNSPLFERAKLLSSMGRTDSQAVFWSDELGWQYTIGNLSAALALAQVERIEELVQRKRDIFSWYDSRLRDCPQLTVIREKPNCRSNYAYPSILLSENTRTRRDDILKTFRELNIHARPGFPQMSRFPMYVQRFQNPHAAAIAQRGISLPSAANTTEEDAAFVCETLKALL